ncbi:DUF6371 domain-containing protein [Nafulsella turpanensis]|uniref:DUF6371 domain-containing protein n=1 Tax=Nafulsella turpanensis TaxID=1265690 RepID=UPI000345DDBF|nr:DUF6371 domain-containing protein [Nafulsella turpanensis]
MGYFKFILEKYKGPNSRYTCVGCGKRRQFSRYISIETGEYLADHVGICNRKIQCGYHYSPKQYFADTGLCEAVNYRTRIGPRLVPSKQIMSFPKGIVKKSLLVSSYKRNSFINFLLKFIDEKTVSNLVEDYFIGTSNHWPGATVFWLIDGKGQCVGGQVVSFDSTTGHTLRVKGKRCTTWAHKALQQKFVEEGRGVPVWLKEYIEHAEKFPVPFGLHLALQEQNKPVAIVEAPKTAVIASAFFSEFIWLAIGSLSWLNQQRLHSLAGREIVLFPDISMNGRAFDLWSAKANELKDFANITVSDFLEHVATGEEKVKGLDLADYLIRCYFN